MNKILLKLVLVAGVAIGFSACGYNSDKKGKSENVVKASKCGAEHKKQNSGKCGEDEKISSASMIKKSAVIAKELGGKSKTSKCGAEHKKQNSGKCGGDEKKTVKKTEKKMKCGSGKCGGDDKKTEKSL